MTSHKEDAHQMPFSFFATCLAQSHTKWVTMAWDVLVSESRQQGLIQDSRKSKNWELKEKEELAKKLTVILTVESHSSNGTF